MKRFLALTIVLSSIHAYAQNPFKQFGDDSEILTMSNGRFNEFHDLDSVVQIGSILLDVNKKVIVGYVKEETTDYMPSPTLISRWWSPDPHADSYYSVSPYAFSVNNPVNFVDPDGQDFIAIIEQDKKGNYTITIKTTVHTYGKDSNADKAKAWTEGFAKLGIEKKFGSEGQHTVKFDVTYEHHDSQESAKEAVENSPGDNLMQVDESLSNEQLGEFSFYGKQEAAKSYEDDLTIAGGRESNVRNSDAVYHSTGHLFGLGDRYFTGQPGQLKPEGYENDIMNNGKNPSEVNRTHYLLLSQFILNNQKSAEKGSDSRTFIYRDRGRVDKNTKK
ncbi:MAG TPA: hypothetical protein VIM65_11275 [Cyclobacteriaceae bacterium]